MDRGSAYKRAGAAGIVCNVVLSALKAALGIITGSVAILADAANNLSDIASAVVTLIGFRLSKKEKDAGHPYGHQRIEYFTGVIISFLIIFAGLQLLMESIKKIIDPVIIEVDALTISLLVFAIVVKACLSVYNYRLADKVDSLTLKAVGVDARNDCLSTAVVLASLIIGSLLNVALDGVAGAAVSMFIIWSGGKIAFETAGPLLGQAPNPDFVNDLTDYILDKDGVMGVHDLVVHDYGPENLFASVHIEVNADVDILVSHELADDIETETAAKFGVVLVAHLDPIDTRDPLVRELREDITRYLLTVDGALGVHDLRIVKGERHTNAIFDIVLSASAKQAEDELKHDLSEYIREKYPRVNTVISVDVDYTGH